jgi:hypothetical protein
MSAPKFTNTKGCFACDQFVLPIMASSVSKDDDLALCTYHWNWWVVRWLNADDTPPCNAHLMDGAES